MFARVLRMRQMGVLAQGPLPPESGWAAGVFEMSSGLFDGKHRAKRLVLRDARASPDKGLLFELFQPCLVEVQGSYLRLRGIEPVSLGVDQTAGMLQEWLVRVME